VAELEDRKVRVGDVVFPLGHAARRVDLVALDGRHVVSGGTPPVTVEVANLVYAGGDCWRERDPVVQRLELEVAVAKGLLKDYAAIDRERMAAQARVRELETAARDAEALCNRNRPTMAGAVLRAALARLGDLPPGRADQ
jgi:hypothetical protein